MIEVKRKIFTSVLTASGYVTVGGEEGIEIDPDQPAIRKLVREEYVARIKRIINDIIVVCKLSCDDELREQLGILIDGINKNLKESEVKDGNND